MSQKLIMVGGGQLNVQPDTRIHTGGLMTLGKRDFFVSHRKSQDLLQNRSSHSRWYDATVISDSTLTERTRGKERNNDSKSRHQQRRQVQNEPPNIYWKVNKAHVNMYSSKEYSENVNGEDRKLTRH